MNKNKSFFFLAFSIILSTFYSMSGLSSDPSKENEEVKFCEEVYEKRNFPIPDLWLKLAKLYGKLSCKEVVGALQKLDPSKVGNLSDILNCGYNCDIESIQMTHNIKFVDKLLREVKKAKLKSPRFDLVIAQENNRPHLKAILQKLATAGMPYGLLLFCKKNGKFPIKDLPQSNYLESIKDFCGSPLTIRDLKKFPKLNSYSNATQSFVPPFKLFKGPCENSLIPCQADHLFSWRPTSENLDQKNQNGLARDLIFFANNSEASITYGDNTNPILLLAYPSKISVIRHLMGNEVGVPGEYNDGAFSSPLEFNPYSLLKSSTFFWPPDSQKKSLLPSLNDAGYRSKLSAKDPDIMKYEAHPAIFAYRFTPWYYAFGSAIESYSYNNLELEFHAWKEVNDQPKGRQLLCKIWNEDPFTFGSNGEEVPPEATILASKDYILQNDVIPRLIMKQMRAFEKKSDIAPLKTNAKQLVTPIKRDRRLIGFIETEIKQLSARPPEYQKIFNKWYSANLSEIRALENVMKSVISNKSDFCKK